MKVEKVMKKHVVTVEPDATMSKVSKILTNNRIGSVVILDNKKNPMGMVTTNDIVTLVSREEDLKKIKVGEYWKKRKRPFVYVKPDDGINSIAKKMIKMGLKRFPVIEDGKLKGIISTKEIILVAPEMLELLSEKLKAKVERVANPEEIISGVCENCGEYSDELKNVNGRWYCPVCRDQE